MIYGQTARWRQNFLLAICLILFFATGVAGETFAVSTLEIEDRRGIRHSFSVELASTPAQRRQGLMHRQQLALNNGMLFDFGGVKAVAMWMKETYLSLDLLFLDHTGRVVYIAEQAQPMSLERIEPPQPVRAVLELPGGSVVRLDLELGNQVFHPIF